MSRARVHHPTSSEEVPGARTDGAANAARATTEARSQTSLLFKVFLLLNYGHHRQTLGIMSV